MTMKNLRNLARLAACAGVLALLGGCAFGQKIAYSDTVADVGASGDKSLALATYDQRPYVVTGKKKPTFVGLSRGGYGNPFDVHTISGAPLADDFSASVSRSLAARGFKTAVVRVGADQSHRAAMDALRGANAERLVMITLNEWKSDTYVNTDLHYDAKVSVYDQAGQELATANFRGDEELGRSPVQYAFKRKLEDWFSDPKIVAALR